MRLQRPDLMETYKAEHDEMKSLRSALTCGFYPGMGTGDPDLYKAFCWRFWNLCTAEHGHIGVVLPRIAFAGKGSKEFRKEVFSSSEQFDLTVLVNNRQWVFPDIHPQYTIGLVCIQRGIPNERSIRLRGPFTSIALFSEHSRKQSAAFSFEDIVSWNDTLSLPLLPNHDSVPVFMQLRKAPRLDTPPPETGLAETYWRARPDREMDATLQKEFMVLDRPENTGERVQTQNSTPQDRRDS